MATILSPYGEWGKVRHSVLLEAPELSVSSVELFDWNTIVALEDAIEGFYGFRSDRWNKEGGKPSWSEADICLSGAYALLGENPEQPTHFIGRTVQDTAERCNTRYAISYREDENAERPTLECAWETETGLTAVRGMVPDREFLVDLRGLMLGVHLASSAGYTSGTPARLISC